MAKVIAPVGRPVELDCLCIYAMPGDVTSDAYEACSDAIPEFSTFLYGVGHISQNHIAQVLADNTKIFTVSLSDYVNGSPKSSTIQCIYPATRRWANVPMVEDRDERTSSLAQHP
ncbi:hypothetical protein B0H13DRAFT_2300254 [Mycena leptocephala]|nr:hypothetical protein B0H13DRAFT_2300254 [Mycena leptocephala]